MNVKISKEKHEELSNLNYKEFLFGSQLHGIATSSSDYDYIRIIGDEFYDRFNSLARYFPNVHSWQFDDKENNSQYVWLTERQFYSNLFSGDGNMLADIVILSGEFENELKLVYSYKIIKGYLGVAKRDLKLHGNQEKKRFHAARSLMMAEMLMAKNLPNVEDIKNLRNQEFDKDELIEREKELRKILNTMLDNSDIDLYPFFKEEDELVTIMKNSNNITQFKY